MSITLYSSIVRHYKSPYRTLFTHCTALCPIRFRAFSSTRMPPIISEILKFTVAPGFNTGSAAFVKLRKSAAQGGVKEQYYGFDTVAPSTFFWVIRSSWWPSHRYMLTCSATPSEWPGEMNPANYKGSDPSEDFRESVKALDVNSNPTSYHLPFESADMPRPALTAPLCQLVCIISPTLIAFSSILPSVPSTWAPLQNGKSLPLRFTRPSRIVTRQTASPVDTGVLTKRTKGGISIIWGGRVNGCVGGYSLLFSQSLDFDTWLFMCSITTSLQRPTSLQSS